MSYLCSIKASIAWFIGSELNNICHWKAHLLIVFKKFRVAYDIIFKKSDMPLSNTLHDDAISPDS